MSSYERLRTSALGLEVIADYKSSYLNCHSWLHNEVHEYGW